MTAAEEKRMREQLGRIDERTKNTEERTKAINENLKELRIEVREELEHFVRRAEFTPVKRIAYGLVAALLTSVCAALVMLVAR